MSLEDEAGRALLNPDFESPEEPLARQKGQTRALVWGHWIAHTLLISILVVLATTWKTSCSADDSFPTLQDSLPQEALKMYSKRFNGSIDFRSEWKGMPRPELEAAWNSVTHDGELVLQHGFRRS